MPGGIALGAQRILELPAVHPGLHRGGRVHCVDRNELVQPLEVDHQLLHERNRASEHTRAGPERNHPDAVGTRIAQDRRDFLGVAWHCDCAGQGGRQLLRPQLVQREGQAVAAVGVAVGHACQDVFRSDNAGERRHMRLLRRVRRCPRGCVKVNAGSAGFIHSVDYRSFQ